MMNWTWFIRKRTSSVRIFLWRSPGLKCPIWWSHEWQTRRWFWFTPPGLAALHHSGISAVAGAPLLFPYRSPRGPLHGETCLENGDSMSTIWPLNVYCAVAIGSMSAIGVRLREVDHEHYPVELLIQQGRCRLKRFETNTSYRIYFANCNRFITFAVWGRFTEPKLSMSFSSPCRIMSRRRFGICCLW